MYELEVMHYGICFAVFLLNDYEKDRNEIKSIYSFVFVD